MQRLRFRLMWIRITLLSICAHCRLQDSTEPRVKRALQAYNPYLFFEYLRTIEKYTNEVCRIGYVTLSPERQNIVTYDYDGTIKVWNMQTKQVIHTFSAGETKKINQVVITPADKILGLWHCNDFAEVWDVKTGQKVFTTPHCSEMFSTAVISLDGHSLVSTGDANIFSLWDIQTGEVISYIDIPEEFPRRDFTYSTSQILVTQHAVKNSAVKNYNYILELWDWQAQQVIRTFNTHSPGSPTAAISPDRRLLVSNSRESGTITVWNVRTGHELSTLRSHSSSINGLLPSPDSQTLLIYSEDVTVQVWGCRTS